MMKSGSVMAHSGMMPFRSTPITVPISCREDRTVSKPQSAEANRARTRRRTYAQCRHTMQRTATVSHGAAGYSQGTHPPGTGPAARTSCSR
jgi:hypothetical protein